MSLGEQLAELRNKKGWSLGKLGQATGISIGYIHRIERGEAFPRREKFAAIALSLDAERAPELLAERDQIEFVRIGFTGEEAEVLARLLNATPQERREELIARLREDVSALWAERESSGEADAVRERRASSRGIGKPPVESRAVRKEHDAPDLTLDVR